MIIIEYLPVFVAEGVSIPAPTLFFAGSDYLVTMLADLSLK